MPSFGDFASLIERKFLAVAPRTPERSVPRARKVRLFVIPKRELRRNLNVHYPQSSHLIGDVYPASGGARWSAHRFNYFSTVAKKLDLVSRVASRSGLLKRVSCEAVSSAEAGSQREGKAHAELR